MFLDLMMLCGQQQFVVENKIPPRPTMYVYISADRCVPCNEAKRAFRDAANLPFDVRYVVGLPEWSDTLPTFHWADRSGNGKMIRGWYGLTPTIEAFHKTQISDTLPATGSGKP